MSFEIRPIKPEELPQFTRVASTALIMNPTSFEGMRPEWTLCGFEDGKLATSFGFWPLTLCMNGVDTPMSGITDVGTLPVYRRRGHLRKIMTKHFENLYEKGECSIAGLFATRAAIYQRYGYGVATTRYGYTVEPRYIQFVLPHATIGELREVREDEFDKLVDLYRTFRQPRTGYIHRGKPMWDYGILVKPPEGGSLNKVIYEESGEPKGFVIYAMSQLFGGQNAGAHLMIRDLVWLNYSAYRTIWEHFMNMDLLNDISWGRVPADDPLPHLLLEPRMLKITAVEGLLARLVDVSKIMTQRGYQNEGELTFKVIDEVCPWNQGNWKLEVSGKGSKITATKQSPQVTMPVSTLAMLFFNQITATQAMRMARLDAHKVEALKDWDRVMQTMYRPACADGF